MRETFQRLKKLILSGYVNYCFFMPRMEKRQCNVVDVNSCKRSISQVAVTGLLKLDIFTYMRDGEIVCFGNKNKSRTARYSVNGWLPGQPTADSPSDRRLGLKARCPALSGAGVPSPTDYRNHKEKEDSEEKIAFLEQEKKSQEIGKNNFLDWSAFISKNSTCFLRCALDRFIIQL